jgi:hypothetical protein
MRLVEPGDLAELAIRIAQTVPTQTIVAWCSMVNSTSVCLTERLERRDINLCAAEQTRASVRAGGAEVQERTLKRSASPPIN